MAGIDEAMTSPAYNIFDLRELARRRLPKGLFEFVDRGAEDEVSLRHNRAALERIKLRPRTLVDVSQRSQEITLLGHRQQIPIAVAPTGAAGIMWHDGEIALARAAAAAGIPFTLATASMTAMDRIAEEAGGRLWFQLYMYADRSLSHGLARRAASIGYEALLVTVDSPVFSNREYNLRNGFTIPISFTLRNTIDVLTHPRWLAQVLMRYVLTTGLPLYANYPEEVKKKISAQPMGRALRLNDSLTWDDVRVLRELWPGKLLLKGLLHPQDAVKAAGYGVDAVIVSNHGGRVLDGVVAPIDVLPEFVEAAGNRLTVIVDSGFRRGADVVKALALGASAVLVGRSTLYGVAAGGEAGAARAIAIFREEIDRVLALLGCSSIGALNPDYLVLP
jgi:isopentenyl diphosphate isomerase/L-lactate dehydrogenase-like FMN-dependent dehydrogenase